MNPTRESDEILKLAHELNTISKRISNLNLIENGPMPPVDLVQRAENIYRTRRSRARYFDENLFGEPAWDLLLDIFIHSERGSPLSVSSACIGAAVPTTTALRSIAGLLEQGLLHRVPDQRDGRRVILIMTEEGRRQMRHCLEQAEF